MALVRIYYLEVDSIYLIYWFAYKTIAYATYAVKVNGVFRIPFEVLAKA